MCRAVIVPLRFYIMLIFCLLALTPVLLFRAWPHSAVLENELAEVEERHLLLARNLASSLERYQRDIDAAFHLLVLQRESWGAGAQLASIMGTLNLRHVCIADRETGRVVNSLSRSQAPCPEVIPGGTLQRMALLANPDGVSFGEVVAAADGTNVMHLVLELDTGRLAIGAIGTDYFQELGQKISFGVLGHAAIVDHAGNVLSHPRPDWVAERRNIAGVSAVQRMMAGESGVEVFYSPALESEMIAGFTSAEPVGWGVMVPQPLSELQATADAARRSTLYVLLIGAGGALALALLVSLLAVRNVEALTASARRIADGDFSSPPRSRFMSLLPREIQELHAMFRRMVFRLKESRGRMHRLAFQDRTTALGNRECFRRRVEAFLDGMRITDKAALLFIDLDGFKAVNDTMGHDAGDDILGQVGARLKAVMGGAVLAPEDPILKDVRTMPSVARLGGDEFAVFLPQADTASATDLAERIRVQIEMPYPYEQHFLTLGASVGVACVPYDAYRYAELLKAADIAMYEAKRGGKNQVRVFGASPPMRRERRHQMAEDLFSAEVSRQIETHFQPYYRAGDMTVTGVEALIRWLHPKYGLLTPRSFFEMVAELGLQRRIDDLAFERSIAAMTALSESGARIGELSLNIPVERLLDERFVSRVLSVLPLPFQLIFELTETSFPEAQLDRAHWSIDRLRDAGVRFELDDFGSVQGSLTAMLELAPHRIKIDARLVAQVHHPGGALLVGSLIRMAHELEIEVVAKGVERLEQVGMLRGLGVDYVQGFALNRPLSPEELAAHLHDPASQVIPAA